MLHHSSQLFGHQSWLSWLTMKSSPRMQPTMAESVSSSEAVGEVIARIDKLQPTTQHRWG
jgi:hypothetical protein